MKLIKVAAASLNQTPFDWVGNKNNILSVINNAKEDDVQVLCLPELCITGYNCEDAFFLPHLLEEAQQRLRQIASETAQSGMLITLGLPVLFEKAIYNCIAVVYAGAVHALVPKQNLCADGVHYESRWFKAWPANKVGMVGSVPIGDLMIDFGGTRIGFEICEDAWVSNRPGNRLAERAVDIILNPSASHFAFGKSAVRTGFIKEGSRAFKCAYIYSNLLGNESGRTIYDGSTYIATGGNIIASGPQLSFAPNTLISAVIDTDINLAKQLQNISHHSKEANLVKINAFYSADIYNKQLKSKTYKPIPDVLRDDYEDFTQAVALGLYDYMRKTKSTGFIVSLSGGADSAAVALLVREMVLRVNKELRCLILHKARCKPLNIHDVLTCVYQATENSSVETERAACHLAQNIGAEYHNISVQPMLESYIGVVNQMLGRDVSWKQDDIALQNIQARVRGPSVWFMANVKNALLLSTSNRSEAAVGYASMDGDTCGGLSPIAGVSKEFILGWLKDYESCTLTDEFDGLRYVLAQKPTAELRPQGQNQTDEEDLMPYPILNRIEVMVVRDKMSPLDIYQQLTDDNVSGAKEYVIKFFKLFCRNQWKRERYAPSFHLDDESLDPKTFLRFPILNSGFQYELQILEGK